GNQGQASEYARLIAETIWSGAIGAVREIHAGSNRYPPISPRGIRRPTETPAIPRSLDWNLWLGPAPERPYHPSYHPFAWRGWWDFGTGALGDMACHIMDASFWALKLGYPTRVEAGSPPIHRESPPPWSVIRYEFPEREGLPPV